ncbi:uncharacterized protein PRCAT00002784001 [Priceomyces carsonii]|uniref:uncharacterized protein n=1 Tax=Priceomyces carsonii TaxID=28549 RepID=UPI002EDA3BC5|nr:unnamed protein product [Priceomyces carsonii]
MVSSQNKKKPNTSVAILSQIFDRYKDPQDESVISIDGTMAYLDDLGIDPDDILSLTLAYFLESTSMGIFSREKFVNNWNDVNVSTIKGMKDFIEQYNENQILSNEDNFRYFYDFAFDYVKENKHQKVIGYDLAVDYWKLLLSKSRAWKPSEETNRRLDQWYDFIINTYKRNISKDSWEMFYLFVKDIISTDPVHFKDYDEMSAWPSIIDDYVEYLHESKKLEG